MTGRHRVGWLAKWFVGSRYWVGYCAGSVVVTMMGWFAGPRLSYAVAFGIEAGFLALIIVGLLLSRQCLAAEKANRAAGERAWLRAAAERREVEAMYRRMRATVEGEGPL